MMPALLEVSLSTQTWTIVGIVIGAVLGGLSQVTAGWLRHRHEDGKTLRANQQSVYVLWLRSLHDFFVEYGRVETWANGVVHGPFHRSLWHRRRGSEGRRSPTAFAALVDRSAGIQAELRLVAPDDTYEQALLARERVTELIGGLDALVDGKPVEAVSEELREAFFESRNAFVRLAKRDLGIPV